MSRCKCGTFVATLHSTGYIRKGGEVTVSMQEHVINFEYSPSVEITWDGGAKEVGGVRVAGAAAILWSASDALGNRNPLVISSVSLPGEKWGPIAESF
eukprot:3873881-Heterocapsa_arctica.AAC.1